VRQSIEEAGLERVRGAARGSAALAGRWRIATTVALMLLLGIDLRAVILGVLPILPLIGHDLGLDHTATGLLTALPVLVFGALALPSGVLAGRIGGRTSVALGLALLAAGALLRMAWPAALPLYAFTVLLSVGIAIAQTAAPVLVRQWFPSHVGLVAALFTDGLIIGEAVAAGATVPLMGALFGPDGWRGAFLIWSIPVVATLALWLLLAPAALATTPRQSAGDALPAAPYGTAAPEPPRRVSALHMGSLLGCGSLMYFGMNGMMPMKLHRYRH
jgi:MFS transporter, CP family, cyanate transporter